jgi:asparagine synthase (glutamine-hydrolysing)
LRSTYQEKLPQAIINRPKVSFDVGSGIREVVVSFLRRNGKSEREELKSIWTRYYFSRPQDAYFDSYPAFDAAIDQRGAQHR